MNRAHAVLCSSGWWAHTVERELLPWGLSGVDLGDDDVEIVHADATAMPFADGRFSGVVCFTMLHHVPSPQLQNRLLAEVSRVLRGGGVFAGTDSLGTGRAFRLLHIGDTLVPVSPDELPARLEQAGLI